MDRKLYKYLDDILKAINEIDFFYKTVLMSTRRFVTTCCFVEVLSEILK